MKRSGPRLVAAACLSAACCAATLGHAPPAAAESVLAVASVGDPLDPQTLWAEDDEPVRVAVSATQPGTTLLVTGAGAGLVVAPVAPIAVTAGSTVVELPVRATTPGFHSLTVTVSADGADPATTVVERLWSPGGPHLAGSGSLAGRTLGFRGSYRFDGSSFEQQEAVTFLTDTTAVIGLTKRGRTTCDSPQWTYYGCVSYAYDAPSGLLEIGRYAGRVTAAGVLVDGLGQAEGETFGPALFDIPLATPRPRRAVAARWGWKVRGDVLGGLDRVRLILRRDRSFELTVHYPGDRPVTLRGRYQFAGNARLVLDRQGPGRISAGLLLRTGPEGRPRPGLGAWLSYPVGEGRLAEAGLYPLT